MQSMGLERAKAIFSEALEKTDSERQAFLDEACGKDTQLRAEVEAFLSAARRAGDFLASPTENAAATTMNRPESAIREDPGTRIGPYKLLQLIGEGGFGSVFMAEQEKPIRRHVALKVIKLGMDTKQVIARFEVERQALAMMEHPNIARVFDAGTTESGRPYFVMELVRGIPIMEYCNDQKLTNLQRIELFIQVCQAIQHAHQKGVIHRDLKPSNVLVTMHDDKPIPKVIDFGIAKATSARLTEKTLFTEYRQFIGTPAYMSPEQAQLSGLDIDTRSDIYSLGVLLYELLTGSTPFDSKELYAAGYEEIRRIIREVEPPKPSTRISSLGTTLPSVAQQRRIEPAKFAKSITGDLDWIVMKCLEKDRTRRYETANGLMRDIERYLSDEPVEASPPSASYRLRKFVHKYRIPLRVGASFVSLLLAATVISSWQAARAGRASASAMASERRAVQERRIAELRQAELLIWRGENLALSEKSWRQAPALYDEATRLLQKNDVQEDIHLLSARGRMYARVGRFREAAADFSRLMDVRPQDFSSWHQGMPLLLQIGDVEGYRRRRAEALRRFGSTSDQMTAQTIPKDCLMIPVEGGELQQVIALADRATNNTSPAWFFQMKGMAEYRAGRFQKAIPWLTESMDGGSADRRSVGEFFLAMVYQQLNDPPRARTEFQRGVAIVEHELVLTDSNFPDWILCQLARREAESLLAHGASANPLATQSEQLSNLREAEATCRQTIVECQKLIRDFPGESRHSIELGHSLWRLAEVLASMQRTDEAEATLQQARTLFEGLIADDPKSPYYRQDLARTYRRLGDLWRAAGRERDAANGYRQTRDILLEIAADHPNRSFYFEDLGDAFAQLGNLLTAMGQSQEADESYRQSIPYLERLAVRSVALIDVPWGLADTSFQYAKLLYSQGRVEEAGRVCRGVLQFLVQRAGRVENDFNLSKTERDSLSQVYRDRARRLLRNQIDEGLHTRNSLKEFARWLVANPDPEGRNAAWAVDVSKLAAAPANIGRGSVTTQPTTRPTSR